MKKITIASQEFIVGDNYSIHHHSGEFTILSGELLSITQTTANEGVLLFSNPGDVDQSVLFSQVNHPHWYTISPLK